MRPRIHANVAMTLDGCMGGAGRTPLRISNAEDLRRVHDLRARSDAILVGVGTVVADDPKLTVKWELLGRTGRSPLRIVLDPQGRTPETALVLDGKAPSLLLVGKGAPERPGRDLERVAPAADGLDLGDALERLARRGVRSLLVEGGPRTLRRFFAQDLVDEFSLFVAPRALGEPSAPRLFEEEASLPASLRLASAAALGDGILAQWRR